MDDAVPGISCGVEHLHAGSSTFCLFGERTAVHSIRQDHVSEEEVHPVVRLKDIECGSTVDCFQNVVAEFTEHTGAISAKIIMILDQEDGLLSTVNLARDLLGASRSSFVFP